MPSHGGGGFGGGHSSGGSSGGGGGFHGGSSGGFGGGRPSGGFGGSRPPMGGGFYGRPRPPMGGGFYGRPRPPRPPMGGYYGRPGRGGGCGCGSFLAIPIIIVIVLVCGAIFSFNDLGFAAAEKQTDGDGITQSTHVRTKMDASKLHEIDTYITDEAGVLKDDVNVRESMRYFYNKTGVQPYLYLIESIGGTKNPKASQIEDFAFEQYSKLFGSDEGHYLIVYVPFSNYDYEYYVYFLRGDNTEDVMDEEAAAILQDYLNHYSGSGTRDDMFMNAFRSTADRIMDSSAVVAPVKKGVPIWGFFVLGIVVVAVVSMVIVSVRKKKEKEAAEEETQDFNGTPS